MVISSQNLRDIETALHKLEGVSAGLSPFYSRIAWFMDQQISTIWRTLQLNENIFQELNDPMNGRSKPGFEDIDREALADPKYDSPETAFAPTAKKRLKSKIADRKLAQKLNA